MSSTEGTKGTIRTFSNGETPRTITEVREDGQTPSNISEGDSKIDPNDWLKTQLMTRITNGNEASNLINNIYHTPKNKRPSTSSVLKLIDSKFASAFPVDRVTLSNPQSKYYKEVKKLVEKVISKLKDIDILYSTSIEDTTMADSRKVIILQLDIHGDQSIMQSNYNLQKALYMSDEIPMSSSLIEGMNDPSYILPQIHPGYSATNLMRDGVGPEGVIQYEFKQGANSPNKNYVKHTAEEITETENIRACLHGLLAISAGVYRTYFPNEHSASANHVLGLLAQSYKEAKIKKLDKDFLIAFALRLEEELERININQNTKSLLFIRSVMVFLEYLDCQQQQDAKRWSIFYEKILPIIRGDDDSKFREYYNEVRFEYNIADRNDNIVQTVVNSGPGTRAMIIGKNHIDRFWSKDKQLVKLFEDAKIPVIVVGKKNRYNGIQF